MSINTNLSVAQRACLFASQVTTGLYLVVYVYTHIYTGRGESNGQLFDDTWAFDMESLEWKVVNTTLSLEVNGTEGPVVPEGRIDPAGGVWENLLWLSMGRNKDQRTLSDLWLLNVTMTEENGELELVGECLFFHLFSHTYPYYNLPLSKSFLCFTLSSHFSLSLSPCYISRLPQGSGRCWTRVWVTTSTTRSCPMPATSTAGLLSVTTPLSSSAAVLGDAHTTS